MTRNQALVVTAWFTGIMLYIATVLYTSVELGHAYGPLFFLVPFVVAIVLAEVVVHIFFETGEEQ